MPIARLEHCRPNGQKHPKPRRYFVGRLLSGFGTLNATGIRSCFAETDDEVLNATLVWNALVEPGDRISGILRAQLGIVGSLQKVLTKNLKAESGLTSAELAAAYERWLPRYSPELPADMRRTALRSDAQLLLPTDNLWPKALTALGDHAPIALWFRGNPKNFASFNRAVAIVGSRTCTSYGQRVTADTVNGLVKEGGAIISGGALGVDAVAHRVTLSQGAVTVAVMAGSLDNLYPSGNWQLFDEISHTGLLLSEMAPGSKPTRWRFLQRNRLIAALSEAVVVTEAGWRSGSINTASHANVLNRRVFAVPGPINSPSSAGCNRLIRDQLAELLLDAADLPLELGWREPSIPDQSSLGSLELRALDALTTREQPFETIAIASGLSRAELTLALGGLQIAQLALRGEGNGWLRTH